MTTRRSSLCRALTLVWCLSTLFGVGWPYSALGASPFTATFLGLGRDQGGELSRFHIQLRGLRALPTNIVVLSDTAGLWVSSSTGGLTVELANFDGSSADIFLTPFA